MTRLSTLLLVLLLLSQAWIDLELALDLPGWQLNAPVVDLLALAMLPVCAAGLVRERWAPPGGRAWIVFALVATLGVMFASDVAHSAHQWLRRIAFMTVAYGLGVSFIVARVVSLRAVLGGAFAFSAFTALLSMATSGLRIAAGDSLWFAEIEGLTPNHKTLAVALAGWIPVLWGSRAQSPWPRAVPYVLALVLLAIGLSLSKTAYLGAALGVGWFWPRSRPLMTRPAVAIVGLALGVALAVASPFLFDSKSMLDAARSRHSLDLRAWTMFKESPLVGAGVGMNVVHEMVTFPEYRVNGVDAHGVIQKVGSETGLLGLGAYLVAAGSLLRRARQRAWATIEGAKDGLLHGALGTLIALHFQLLLSTETYSPTHWTPLAVAWGLLARTAAPTGPPSHTPEPA